VTTEPTAGEFVRKCLYCGAVLVRKVTGMARNLESKKAFEHRWYCNMLCRALHAGLEVGQVEPSVNRVIADTKGRCLLCGGKRIIVTIRLRRHCFSLCERCHEKWKSGKFDVRVIHAR